MPNTAAGSLGMLTKLILTTTWDRDTWGAKEEGGEARLSETSYTYTAEKKIDDKQE